jgi:hypothetical protein
MATATPLGPPGPDGAKAARRVAQAGRAAICRQDPSSPRARRGRSLPRCGELISRTPPRHRAPNREPARILIPGDGAAGDQEAQNKPACPAMAATRRLRPVPSQRTYWRYDLRRTCRLVTGRSHRPRSTWPNQARLRSWRSRTAINGHIVFGSNNFSRLRSADADGIGWRNSAQIIHLCPPPVPPAPVPWRSARVRCKIPGHDVPGGVRSWAVNRSAMPVSWGGSRAVSPAVGGWRGTG